MYPSLHLFCDSLLNDFDSISNERKLLLQNISTYIQTKKDNKEAINLVYICTHNSRRSHFGQVWAAVAAHYYQIKKVHTFSGGTEVTAFNTHAIKALKTIGFEITSTDLNTNNARFKVKYGIHLSSDCFSKVYNDSVNPTSKFAAIMTCSNAETNCPFIPDADLRIATTYEDPKQTDNTPLQDETYLLRCKQIATEIFYMFSLIK